MANIKISELNSLSKKASNDVLPIVDVSADETKKIKIEDLLDKNVSLIAVSDTAPAECSTGDKYFNTTTNLIYTAVDTDTWSETGEEPIEGIFYVVFNEQSSYAYNGTTLISVGGGTEDIIISDEEPTTDDWKIWIDSGEVNNLGSEVVDSLAGNETNFAPSVRAVKEDLNTYSTDEIRIGTYLGKPLYRKTITGTITQRSTEINVNLNASIDKVAKIEGNLLATATGQAFGINYYLNSTSSTYVKVYVNSASSNQNTVGIYQNITGGDVDYFVIIEYTKTTD